MEFVARKFHEMAEVNQEHARKQVKEAAKFKHNFLELLKTNGNQESAIVNSSSVMLDDETQSCEPVMFEGEDLTKIFASDGPSCFGRLLGSKIFGSNKKCTLTFERLGSKYNRKNGRRPCAKEKEELFKSSYSVIKSSSFLFKTKDFRHFYFIYDFSFRLALYFHQVSWMKSTLFSEVVRQKFPSNPDEAVAEAIRGANQYGSEMKALLSVVDEHQRQNDQNNDN